MFTASIDTRSVVDALEAVRANVPAIQSRIINRSVNSTEVLASRSLASHLGLPVSTLRNPKYGAIVKELSTPDRLIGHLIVSGPRLPLTLFKPYQSVKGVAYQLPGGQGFIPRAFMAEMPSGHRGVFIRRFLEKPIPPGRGRLPIVEKKGPSLPRVLLDQWERDIQDKAESEMQKHLNHEVQFALSKGRD